MPDVLEVKNELSQKIDYGIVIDDLKKKVDADLSIAINGVDDKAGYKLADTRRKEWVKVRTGIDKTRKNLNALAREHIKRVDAVAAELTEIAGRAEDHVTKLVDAIDAEIAKAEQEKIDAVYNVKNGRLLAAGLILPRILVDSMSDIDVDDKISEAEELAWFRKQQAEKEAEAKAEAERRAAEEKERNRIEAEKLAKERADFERQQAEAKAEQDRLAKIEADKLAAEREQLNRQKVEQEKAARLIREQQEEAQRNIEAEQKRLADIELARIEAEQQAERDRLAAIERNRLETERVERERIEAEEQAKRDEAARVRAEQLKPDREKLAAFANELEAMADKVPDVSPASAFARQLVGNVVKAAAGQVREIVEARVK